MRIDKKSTIKRCRKKQNYKHWQQRNKRVQQRNKQMRQNIMLLEDVSFVLILPNVQVMLNKMQPIVRLTDRNDLPKKYLGRYIKNTINKL